MQTAIRITCPFVFTNFVYNEDLNYKMNILNLNKRNVKIIDAKISTFFHSSFRSKKFSDAQTHNNKL